MHDVKQLWFFVQRRNVLVEPIRNFKDNHQTPLKGKYMAMSPLKESKMYNSLSKHQNVFHHNKDSTIA